jgi:hypothetical protein
MKWDSYQETRSAEQQPTCFVECIGTPRSRPAILCSAMLRDVAGINQVLYGTDFQYLRRDLAVGSKQRIL